MRHKLTALAMLVAFVVSATALAGTGQAAPRGGGDHAATGTQAAKKKKKRCGQRKRRHRRCAKPRRPARPRPPAPAERPGTPPQPAEPESAPGPEGYVTGEVAEREAVRRLGGARFIGCGSVICGTAETFARRLDLCGDGRLIYQTYSGRERVGGRWYLHWARLTPGHVEAQLTLQTDDLSLTTSIDLLIVDPTAPNAGTLTRIDGEEVSAGRSELCG